MTEPMAHVYQPMGDLIVEGPDSAHFLQGQFSQDLRVPVGTSVYGLWLDAKGKIQADSFLLKESDGRFRAISYFSPTAFLQENLEKRIIMDDVATLTSETPASGVSLWGDAIDLAVGFMGIGKPEPGTVSIGSSCVAFWGRRSVAANLEMVFSEEKGAVQELMKFLEDKEVQILNTKSVDSIALRDQSFQVGKDILASDLPQETNLGEVAVSYQKGCYIGQEVMARLKSMGAVRKSLQCVTLSKIPMGEGPWELIGEEGRKAGDLRRVLEFGSSCIGSAMLKRSMDEAGCFRVREQTNVKVSRQPR